MAAEQSPVRSPQPASLPELSQPVSSPQPAPKDPAPEPSQLPSSPQLAPKEGGGKRQKAEDTVAALHVAKRPRYNDKAFGDLSVNELEGIVKEAIAYKKTCASQEAEIAQLKDVRAEKAAMAKRIKALEGELDSAQKEAERSRSAIREQGASLAEQTERVKLAIRKSLTQQMVFHPGLKEKLQSEGREIVAFVANVSPEMLKELGAKPGAVTKYADCFFSGELTRSHNNGVKVVLARSIVLKYVKTTCELRVDATYMLEGAKKKPNVGANKKPKKKARGAAKKGAKDAAEDAEDGDADEDEEEDGGNEEMEEAGEDDAEEMDALQPAAA